MKSLIDLIFNNQIGSTKPKPKTETLEPATSPAVCKTTSNILHLSHLEDDMKDETMPKDLK
jgi:hypothetical protein